MVKRHSSRSSAKEESGAAACLQGLLGEGLHCTRPPEAERGAALCPVGLSLPLCCRLPCCRCVHLHWTGAPSQHDPISCQPQQT